MGHFPVVKLKFSVINIKYNFISIKNRGDIYQLPKGVKFGYLDETDVTQILIMPKQNSILLFCVLSYIVVIPTRVLITSLLMRE